MNFKFNPTHVKQALTLYAQLPDSLFGYLRGLGESEIYVDSNSTTDDTLNVGAYSIVACAEVRPSGVQQLWFAVYEFVTVHSNDRMTPDDVDAVEFTRVASFSAALKAVALREAENLITNIQHSDALVESCVGGL